MLLLCGGNIDTTTFGRCLERGLASEGRLLRLDNFLQTKLKFKLQNTRFLFKLSIRFNVCVEDCPGGIAQLCRLLANIGVTIKDIMHERAWLKDIYNVEVMPVLSFKLKRIK